MAGIEYWIVLAAFCFIGEMLTTGFFLLWFAVGASLAALLNYLGFDPAVQIISFIIISLLLIALSRPLAQRITREPPRKAASDRLIGRKGWVVEDVKSDSGGVVKVDGDVWRAISSQNIIKGKKIRVKKVESVKLYVEEVQD